MAEPIEEDAQQVSGHSLATLILVCVISLFAGFQLHGYLNPIMLKASYEDSVNPGVLLNLKDKSWKHYKTSCPNNAALYLGREVDDEQLPLLPEGKVYLVTENFKMQAGWSDNGVEIPFYPTLDPSVSWAIFPEDIAQAAIDTVSSFCDEYKQGAEPRKG